MLYLSRLADYAVVVMFALGQRPQLFVSAGEVSRTTHIAMPTVKKLLKRLLAAQLLASLRGAQGGYQLLKSPASIRLSEIVGAIDGMPSMTICTAPAGICHIQSQCLLQGHWAKINQSIRRLFDRVTLAHLMRPTTEIAWLYNDGQSIH